MLNIANKNNSLYLKNIKKVNNGIIKGAVYFFRLAILLSVGYIIIYPLFYMIVTSFKSADAYYNASRIWFPDEIDPKYNFSMALEVTDFWNALKSTFVYEILAAFIEILSCAVAAYGFARFNFKLKRICMAGLFLTILIPETMILIPRMVNYSHMDFLGILGLLNRLTGVDLRQNLINTPLAFYLPSFFAIGLRSGILIYIYIQFFKSMPYELEEAAWVDGAGPIRTFISIAIPSSGVVFVTVTVFSLIWHWNDSFLASMYLKSDYPLAVNLERITTTLAAYGLNMDHTPEIMSIVMAACLCFIMPMLLLYIILQHWFIESIDRVGITG